MSDSEHDEQVVEPGDVGAVPPLAGSRGVEVVDPETGEVVPASETGLVFSDTIGDAAISQYLQDMREVDDESPEAVQTEIARRILTATTPEAVFGATKVLGAKEMLNQPFVVERVRWITSAHEGGPPKFAIIDGHRVHGDEPITLSCGAMNVVLTLYKLQSMNALPCAVVISSKPSGSDPGRSVLTIQPAP